MADLVTDFLLSTGIDAMTWIWIIIYVVTFGIGGFIVWRDSSSAKKSLILYYETEKVAVMLEKKVEDGIINIGKKRFFVDEANPPLVPTGVVVKSWRPFHVLKWDTALPQNFTREGVKTMSPTNLTNFMENKALDQLLTPHQDSNLPILLVVVGIVFGIVIGYGVFASGIIKGG